MMDRHLALLPFMQHESLRWLCSCVDSAELRENVPEGSRGELQAAGVREEEEGAGGSGESEAQTKWFKQGAGK